jgi:glycerol-3-phosphate dehydrogenase
MVEQLGHDRPCRTKDTPLPGSEERTYMRVGDRLRTRETHLLSEQLVCECELVERSALEAEMRARGSHNLDDFRRSLRLGMGPCQGGFCIYRATGILHALDRLDGAEASASLRHFLEERWRGTWPILYGDQLRQARLDDWIFQGLLDVEHLPNGEVAAAAAATDAGVRPGVAGDGDLERVPGSGSAQDPGDAERGTGDGSEPVASVPRRGARR